jgi:hypothetical protein
LISSLYIHFRKENSITISQTETVGGVCVGQLLICFLLHRRRRPHGAAEMIRSMAFINFDGDHISNTDLVFLPSVSTFAGPGNGATSAQPMSRAKLFFPNNVRADFFFTKSTTFYFAKEFLPSARVFSLLCQKGKSPAASFTPHRL